MNSRFSELWFRCLLGQWYKVLSHYDGGAFSFMRVSKKCSDMIGCGLSLFGDVNEKDVAIYALNTIYKT